MNFIEREKQRKDLRIYTMDYGRKRARKYTFKIPQVEELGKLGKLVVNPQAFKEKYGKLLPLLNTNIVDGILPTLVQFYDPTYHCFPFPDYQLWTSVFYIRAIPLIWRDTGTDSFLSLNAFAFL